MQKVSFLPFKACPVGKAVQCFSYIINPLSWGLLPFYFNNYRKLKTLNQATNKEEWDKTCNRSHALLIAIYSTHIIFFLAANAAAMYCLAKLYFQANRNYSLIATAIYSGALFFISLVFTFGKYQGNTQNIDYKKNPTKSVAFCLMNMSLIMTGPAIGVVGAIFAFPIIACDDSYSKKKGDKNNEQGNQESSETESLLDKSDGDKHNEKSAAKEEVPTVLTDANKQSPQEKAQRV